MDLSPSGPQECIFMAQLTLFNEGGTRTFSNNVGIFIWFPLHKTMVWDLAIGSGNPSTESTPLMYALACINQCCSEGMGIPSSLQDRLWSEDIEPMSRGAKASVSCFSKKNDK